MSRPEVQSLKNYKVELNGVQAFAGATGYSFLFTKDFLSEMPKFKEDRKVGGEDFEWHKVANEMGRLRLTTSELTTDHIGNVLDDYWMGEASRHGIDAGTDSLKIVGRKGKSGNWLIRRSKAQKTIKWTIDQLSRLVY